MSMIPTPTSNYTSRALSSWPGESGGTSQKGRWSSFRNERYRKQPFTRYSGGAGPTLLRLLSSLHPKHLFCHSNVSPENKRYGKRHLLRICW